MSDSISIRMRILEVVIPQATRVGITSPKTLIDSCTVFEEYVLGSQREEMKPDSSTPRKTRRPRNETTEPTPSETPDPALGG